MNEEPTQNLPQDGVKLILARLDSIDARLTALENDVRTGFRRMDRQVGLLVEDVLKVRADQRDLEIRLDKVEPKTMQ